MGDGGEGVAEGLEIEGAQFGFVNVFFAVPFGIGELDLKALAFEADALGVVGLALKGGDMGIEEGWARLVVEEAAVELVADGDGEAGYFSGAGHGG